MTRAVARWIGVCALVLSASAAPARAHLGSTKYLEVTRTDDGARVRVAIDAVDASIALGLGMEPADRTLLARADLLETWIAAGLTLQGEGGACLGRDGAAATETRDGRRFVTLAFVFECPAPVTGLMLRDDTVFDDDPDHQAVVTVRSADGGQARVLHASAREIALDEPASAADTAGIFLVEGAWHLVTGFDHLLFLVSLLLGGSLLTYRRRSLRDAAVLVTAFTVGHSVSLVASSLGWVTLPSGPVELCIAASIVAVALLNLSSWSDVGARPALALAFGLIHGFGFASVLGDVGLPDGHRALALFAFNVGIELAQLAFVAVALPLFAWLAAPSPARQRLVVRVGSVAVAAVATGWVIERIAAV